MFWSNKKKKKSKKEIIVSIILLVIAIYIALASTDWNSIQNSYNQIIDQYETINTTTTNETDQNNENR